MDRARPVGQKLAAARKAAGLSQAALAGQVGLDRSAVAKIENGRRRVKAEELAALAGALGRPVASFLGARTDVITLGSLRSLRDQIESIAARHGAANVRVFGSTARADATEESDIDLLVDMETGRGLFDQAALLVELHELLDRDVDVVTTAALRPRIRRRVINEAVPL